MTAPWWCCGCFSASAAIAFVAYTVMTLMQQGHPATDDQVGIIGGWYEYLLLVATIEIGIGRIVKAIKGKPSRA